MQPGRSAYLGISEESHTKNMRTIHVNAQVTAVTTIFEFIGSCLNGIVFMIFNINKMPGFPEFTQLVLFMQLHFVSLSYVFLMNTRYNKNRIIEHGWINVLKNIIYCGPHSATTSINPIYQETTNPSNMQKEHENNKNRGKRDIFIISDSPSVRSKREIKEKIIVKENNRCTNTDPPPCSSKIKGSKSIITPNNIVKASHDENKSIERIRSKILSDLMLSIRDEDNYVITLLKFVEVEDAYKAGQDVNNLICQTSEGAVSNLPHFVGTIERKFEMRSTMLERMLHYCQDYHADDEVYEECFEQFISMEESFLENGC